MLAVGKRRRLTEPFVAGDLPEVHFRIPSRIYRPFSAAAPLCSQIITFLPQVSPRRNSDTDSADCGQSQDVRLHEGLSGRRKTGALLRHFGRRGERT